MSTTHHRQSARQPGAATVRRTVLPSGLRVVTEDMPGSETFALGFFIDVGSRHEGPTVHGAAHYLEHVLFKGTATRSAEEISAAFDAVGGDANAYTSKEHTCFYAKVLADDADIAVDTIVDMLTHSLLRSEDVEAERDVILDEIAMHNDDAMETAHTLVAQRIFGERLGRDVIGTTASIRGMTRDQVRGFWKRHYRPSNIVVSAAGRVNHKALVARFADWEGVPGEHPMPADGPHRDLPALAIRTKPQEQVSCLLALPGLPRGDRRRYSADLLAAALGGGMSARLFVEVRERRSLAYHIDAATTSYAGAGLFAIEWMSSPARSAEILDVVTAVCADVVQHGISDTELARVKGQMRGALLLANESPEARMMRHGRRELTGDRRSIATVLAGFERVRATDVQRVARELLSQPPVLAVVGGTVERKALRRRLERWPAAMRQE